MQTLESLASYVARGVFNRYELMRLSFLRRELSWGKGREGKGEGRKRRKGKERKKKGGKNVSLVWSL